MESMIEATLPLSPENQIKFFKNKDLMFKINIKESKISPKQCLITLSNMRLNVELMQVSQELLYEYMTGRFVVESSNLPKILANVILGFKYGKMYYSDVEEYFSIDDYAEFIAKHQDILDEWCAVLDSIPLYLLLCSKSFASEDFLSQVKTAAPKIEGEVKGVGVNICQLVALPDFLNTFLNEESINTAMVKPYYTHYFDEYLYFSKNLLNFLASPDYQSDFAIEAFALMDLFTENKVELV